MGPRAASPAEGGACAQPGARGRAHTGRAEPMPGLGERRKEATRRAALRFIGLNTVGSTERPSP